MKGLLASILALSVFITQAATDPYNTLATGTAWVYTTHGNGAVNLNTFILEFDNVTTVPSRSWHRDQENGLRAIGILSSNSSEALDTLTIYWVPEELINPSFDPEDMLDSIRAEPIMLEFYNFKRTGSKGRQSETRSILRTRCFMEFLGMKSPPVIPPVSPGFSPQPPPGYVTPRQCGTPKTQRVCFSDIEIRSQKTTGGDDDVIRINMNVRGGAYVPWVNRVSTGEYIPDATLIIDVSTAAQTDGVGWTVVGAAMLTFTAFAN